MGFLKILSSRYLFLNNQSTKGEGKWTGLRFRFCYGKKKKPGRLACLWYFKQPPLRFPHRGSDPAQSLVREHPWLFRSRSAALWHCQSEEYLYMPKGKWRANFHSACFMATAESYTQRRFFQLMGEDVLYDHRDGPLRLQVSNTVLAPFCKRWKALPVSVSVCLHLDWALRKTVVEEDRRKRKCLLPACWCRLVPASHTETCLYK